MNATNESSTEDAGSVEPLTAEESLLRQQLNVAHYWAERSTVSGEQLDLPQAGATEGPDSPWQLTSGLNPHAWQLECAKRWFASGGRGVVKVVTGAGKTVLACKILERLRNEREPGLRAAIVVPTIVLMDQWCNILESGLPAGCLGRVGGSHVDTFSGTCRVLVCVLNSAASKLPKRAEAAGGPLILVVDECHRAGSKEMSAVFKTPRQYNLGLSATPEREEVTEEQPDEPEEVQEMESFDESVVGAELGPIIYELNYRQAIEAGILSKFVIHHYGLPLNLRERSRYESLSREITDLRRQLQTQGGKRAAQLDGGALVGWARRASQGKSSIAKAAADYVHLTGERKRLLYRAQSRGIAVQRMIHEALQRDPDSRILLFHESIVEVMRLFNTLRRGGVPVVVEHSQLADSLRQESINLFRLGRARVLVSARSLIEGFDVPAADVGIVVASSSSVRQRIQTLGRILRKKSKGGGDGERVATLNVLYAAETTDELIYSKVNWEDLTGAACNRFFTWDPDSPQAPFEKAAPPRRPKPTEEQVDWGKLNAGDVYPGSYEGGEFTSDSQGNVRTFDGRGITNPQDVPSKLHQARGNYGKFRVTSKRHAILAPASEGAATVILFLGFLSEPFSIQSDGEIPLRSGGAALEGVELFAGELTGAINLKLRQKAGGFVLSRTIKDGEVFARTSANAADVEKGIEAENILRATEELGRKHGVVIRNLMVTPAGDVVCDLKGRRVLVMRLRTELEFPDLNLNRK